MFCGEAGGAGGAFYSEAGGAGEDCPLISGQWSMLVKPHPR